jgi:uncharacterized membrane protein
METNYIVCSLILIELSLLTGMFMMIFGGSSTILLIIGSLLISIPMCILFGTLILFHVNRYRIIHQDDQINHQSSRV